MQAIQSRIGIILTLALVLAACTQAPPTPVAAPAPTAASVPTSLPAPTAAPAAPTAALTKAAVVPRSLILCRPRWATSGPMHSTVKALGVVAAVERAEASVAGVAGGADHRTRGR